MLAGIQEIMVISTKEYLPLYRRLLGDGSRLGITFRYAVQENPNGIADAFLIGEDFIETDNVALILGDNIFYGHGMSNILDQAMRRIDGATVFGYQVKDPHRFGVVNFDDKNQAISLEEKPVHPQSNYAVTGLYFYDNKVVEIAKKITPSLRGELEITDINNVYLKNEKLYVENFGRGFAWLDTGTHESLMEAGQFIQTIEHRQGFKVACLEEISYRNGWISREIMIEYGNNMSKTDYGKYLIEIANEIYEK